MIDLSSQLSKQETPREFKFKITKKKRKITKEVKAKNLTAPMELVRP